MAAGPRLGEGGRLTLQASRIAGDHRRLRHRAQDARELPGAGAAAGARGPREGFAAGRLRHRRAAGRSALEGARGAGRDDRARRKAMSSRRRPSGLKGARIEFPVRLGRRDGEPLMAARRWPTARPCIDQRGARAGDRRSRPLPDRDGREDSGLGTSRDRDRRREDAARRRTCRAARPHRDRHLCHRRRDCRRRGRTGRHARRADRRGHPAARNDRHRDHARPIAASPSIATACGPIAVDVDDRAVSRLPDRPAGAVHGADGDGQRHLAHPARRSSRTASCMCRNCCAWAPTSASKATRRS